MHEQVLCNISIDHQTSTFGLVWWHFLSIRNNTDFDSSFSRYHGRNFEDDNEPFLAVVWPVQMGPCVAPLGLWMSGKIEHLNIAPPYRLASKHLMHGHGFNVS